MSNVPNSPPEDFLSEIQGKKKKLDEIQLTTASAPRVARREKRNDERVDAFLKNIRKPRVIIPDPVKDFGMYQRMAEAMDGVHEYLEELRRNYGRVGYAATNDLSDLSKAYIREARLSDEGSEVEMAFLANDMEKLALGINEASANGEISEMGNRFSRTIWQEQLEANFFGLIWPVIVGRTDKIPKLVFWKSFEGNIQAYFYGFLDVVSELAKALNEEVTVIQEAIFNGVVSSDEGMKKELGMLSRYLHIASSIHLRLSDERHFPGYVINNAFGPWAAYSKKLRGVEGCIAHVRREYNTVLREFNYKHR